MNFYGGFLDDFVGAKVSGSILHSRIPWVIAGTGSPVVSVLAGDVGAPGRISLTCSAGGGDTCILKTQAPIALADIQSFAVGLAYSSSAANGYLAAGLCVTPDYGMGEGVYFIHDAGLDSNCRSVSRNGAGSSQSHTMFAAGTAPMTAYAQRVQSDNWTCRTYNPASLPDNAFVGQFRHVAQLPDPSALVYPCVVLSNVTATSKTAIVDFFSLELRQLNRVPGQ